MKSRLLLSFCFLSVCFFSFAQQTPYQVFEVDSAAVPRGGIPYLTVFLQSNLRKPIAAEAVGIGGRIIVSGIIEPDGSISNVKAMNSLRPDCDREAVRAFSLFNAWKPAQKDGKAVRQQVSMPVIFARNTPFLYRDGAMVSYFDTDKKLLADSTAQVRFKQIAPMDTNGFANGDIVVYKISGTNWKEDYRIPLVRMGNKSQTSSDEQEYMIGYQNGNHRWEGKTIVLNKSGRMVSQSYYKNGVTNHQGLVYHANGAVSEKTDDIDGQLITRSWYSSGQIKELRSADKPEPSTQRRKELVRGYWDSTGRELVKDGNGRVNYTEKKKSYNSSLPQTTFVEQGSYENGLQQGIWTGRYEDNSFFYEEYYDKGVFQKGKSRVMGEDTVHYTTLEKQPEFTGGMAALGQFLSQNLRYPEDAQRAKVEGQVFVSFVVNTTGNIIDVDVIKGIGFGADEEAMRVVQKSSGRWTPGIQHGQKVRVKYNLPINFHLQ